MSREELIDSLRIGSQISRLTLDEDTIVQLIGAESAEMESVEELKKYMYKTSHYTAMFSERPLKILIGHKGTGKSAIFKGAKQELKEQSILTVDIKPQEIKDLDSERNINYNSQVWETELIRIISKKIFQYFDIDTSSEKIDSLLSKIKLTRLIYDVMDVIKSESINFDDVQKKLEIGLLTRQKFMFL